MIKQVVFLKKRADLDTAAFRAYYEEHHRKIGERVLAGFVEKYVRSLCMSSFAHILTILHELYVLSLVRSFINLLNYYMLYFSWVRKFI